MGNYYGTLSEYLTYFKTEHGERKYQKIENKIFNSNKVSNLIQISRQKMVVPNHMDYVSMLHEIPYFIFASRDIVALGSLLSLERWNRECNQKFKLATEMELHLILTNIFHQIKQL